jgi:hypothetical protein
MEIHAARFRGHAAQRNGTRNPAIVMREALRMRCSLRSQDNVWIPGSDPLALLGPGNARRVFAS